MDVTVETDERYYRLDGVVFRVRLDRPQQGAHYLRSGTWVWTPITSAAVVGDPHARELSSEDAERYRAIP